MAAPIKVVDASLGLAGALVARLLGDAGAQVTRLTPAAGDPLDRTYEANAVWRADQVRVQVEDLAAALADQLEAADICIVGGEEYPGLDWRVDADALSRRWPRLVVLDLAGYMRGSRDEGRPAADLLVQARSGLAFEYYTDRPLAHAFPAPSYGAALQGLVGVLGALVERQRSGLGQVARTSLHAGALSWLVHFWAQIQQANAASDFIQPRGAEPLIFACKGGDYLHFSMGAAGSKAAIYGILGIDDPGLAQDSRGLPSMAKGLRNFYGDVDLLAAHVRRWDRGDLLTRLWAEGVPAEAVLAPGECWDDAQVRHNGLIVATPDGGRRVGLPIRADAPLPEMLTVETPLAGDAAAGASDRPALEGLKVVDFGNFTAGPHAAMFLRDMGAEVIKVEALGGDPIHGFFRPYSSSSRGKQCIAVDQKTEAGREIVRRLCVDADLVLHNFRPGVAERLGIDPASLRALNPTVITQANAGYGSTGPNAKRGALDMVMQAIAGHEVRAGGEGNPPLCCRPTTVDFASGFVGAIASLLGLYRRGRTGEAVELNTSLLETGVFMLSELVQRADGRFAALPVLDAQQLGFSPTERIYPSKDGWVAVVARSNGMAQGFAAALDLSMPQDCDTWGPAETAALEAATAKLTTSALLARLDARGVWAEACVEDAEKAFFADPQRVASQAVLDFQDHRFGRVKLIGPLFTLSRTRLTPSGHTPDVGEHTRAVLGGLGYAPGEIDSLYAQKIVS